MPIDPIATTAVLVASIQPETQLLFLKMFLAGSGIISGLIASIQVGLTWKG